MIKNRCSPVSLVLSIAIGAFLIGAVSAQAEDGFTNGCVANVIGKKANCTANDVRLTAVTGVPNITETCAEGPSYCVGGANAGLVCTDNTGCPGGVGCFNRMTFTATGQFTAGPQRYDVGVYIATDGDPNGDGARTGTCERFRFDTTDPNAINLDNDSCGDILANTTQEVAFGPVDVACIDTDGNGSVDIINCETWGNAIDEIPDGKTACNEIEDVRAGTPSKCSCGLLPICIAIPDENTCDTEVCRFTCSATSDEVCTSDADCTGAGETCEERVVHVDVADGTVCGADPDPANPCDANRTCVAGECTGTGVAPGPGTVLCRDSACGTATSCCDVPEYCDGLTSVCPANGFATDSHECRAQSGVCDVAESCDGTGANCPADGVVAGGNTVECRASDGSLCDPAEFCDGVNKDCPGDICLGGTPHPTT